MNFPRTASTLITLFGCITNAMLSVHVASTFRSFTFKGEQESEWEGLSDKWDANGLRFLWALLFVYFTSSTVISAVGLYGVLKVRFCIFNITLWLTSFPGQGTTCSILP